MDSQDAGDARPEEVVLNDLNRVYAAIEELRAEQTRLNDLFTRRLLSDRDKEAAYDELRQQLEWARKGLVHGALLPLIRRLVLLVDALPDDSGVDVVDAVRQEMVSLLEEFGLRPVPSTASFDPAWHEAVASRESASPPGTILEEVRPGFLLGAELLRPTQVIVAVE